MNLIFKRSDFSNVVSKQLPKADVCCMKNGNIKISPILVDFLNITEENRLFIEKNVSTGKYYVACVPVLKDEEGKEIAFGKALSKSNSFRNTTLNTILGGELSGYNIDREDFADADPSDEEMKNVRFYALKEVFNGAAERKAAENTRKETQPGQTEENTAPEQTEQEFNEAEESKTAYNVNTTILDL